MKGGIKGGIGAFGRVEALIKTLLLLILNLLIRPWLVSLSCFLVRLAEELTQKLC